MHSTSSSQCMKTSSKRKRGQLEEDRENDDFTVNENQKKRTRLTSSSSSASSSPSTPLSPVNRDLPDFRRSLEEPTTSKSSAMPKSTWLNRTALVNLLAGKDQQIASPSWNYFAQHPNLQPRMRAVLLDWLIEVSEVYNLQRETYYLAVNYIDRFLSNTENIHKTNLQLIGITCLFIASKVEEIYPPKVDRFAYVTDDACSCEDIIGQELTVLASLDWDISTMTVNSWLNLLLQLCNNQDATPKTIIFPNHPVKDYLASAQLLDLAVLDDGSLRFSYQALATAAIFLTTNFKEIVNVPILETDKSSLVECLAWMVHFHEAIKDKCSPKKVYGSLESGYTIQNHHVDMPLLEYAQKRLQQWQLSTSIMLTPPPSHEKIC